MDVSQYIDKYNHQIPYGEQKISKKASMYYTFFIHMFVVFIF